MNLMKVKTFITAMIMVLALASCNGNKFRVSGTIEGAGDSTQLVLEESSNGSWFILDSIKTTGNGAFEVSHQAPQYPGIYRIRMNSQSIYFPIDSIDNISISTKLKTFDTDFTVTGSEHAAQVMQIDKDAIKYMASAAGEEELAKWKRSLADMVLADPGGIVSYYIINKYINGQPLFNPADSKDLKVIGAVANLFRQFSPQDPRTDYLVNLVLNAQREQRAQQTRSDLDTLQVSMTSLFNINLEDYDGVKHDLQSEAGKGNVVILNFTIYEADFSPAFNKILNDTYIKYKNRGLEIYQVSLDRNDVVYRQAAKNLPWITVYDPTGSSSAPYNISSVPTVFIIDRSGVVAKRVDDVTQLPQEVAKYL
ncbi:MAG: AhpC/TSA family protein [Muribaculaceae bacterium]|nr:AhpC/TSA family protein [Muribaculaceae bacterium]